MASAAMKLTWVTEAVAVLLLLTPLVCGQNPDELLVVRLPAKHGRINQPGAAPIPFPRGRDQIAVPRTARRCKSMASGHSSMWCGDRNPSHAVGEDDFRGHCVSREDKGRTGLAPEPKF